MDLQVAVMIHGGLPDREKGGEWVAIKVQGIKQLQPKYYPRLHEDLFCLLRV